MQKMLITIGRQYGSGGREIGKKMAEKLGIAYYDTQLIAKAADHTTVSEENILKYDEAPTAEFLGFYSSSSYHGKTGLTTQTMPVNVQVAFAQFDAIKKIADSESAVIVGRCADYVLSERKDVLNVFVHANTEKRIQRIMERQQVGYDEAERMMRRIDKQRVTYYRYYTDKKWGAVGNYHLSIDSGLFGIDNSVRLIEESYKLKA